jgi:hypothetical protein
MTATATPTEVNRYLDEVRAHLADLPVEERDDLLDDLAVHLEEVAAESDGPLERALGSPAAFAAELRASAGLASREEHGTSDGGVGALRQRLARWQGLAADSEPARWVRALLPQLAPGWWVLRGYLAVVVVSVMGGEHHFPFFPVPSLFGSAVLGLAAIAVAVVASVRLGRHHGDERRPRWVIALDALVVLGTLFAVGVIRDHLGPQYVYSEVAPGTFFSQPDGSQITNLFAYDENGELLEGVLLYDQDGRPVAIGEGDAYSDSGVPLQTRYPLDANGAEITNRYPLDQRTEEWRYGADGSESLVDEPVRPPAIVAPRLAEPEPTTTTTPAQATAVPPPPPATDQQLPASPPAQSPAPAPGA